MRKTSTSGSKDGLNRGAWTATEDKMLTDYITIHGAGKWSHIPKKTDLKRCGKSCRLRWLNYLRPNIKRGNISVDEEELIIRLHNLLGNRWSLIAGRLPGRTDNEIKNYWNTHLVKKAQKQQLQKKLLNKISSDGQPGPSRVNESACTKKDKDIIARNYENDSSTDIPSLVSGDHENSYDFFVDFNVEDFCRTLDSDLTMRRASAANQNAQPSDFISLVSFLDSDVQWPAINSVNTN